jgi:hypothetical protein
MLSKKYGQPNNSGFGGGGEGEGERAEEVIE